MQKQRNRSEYSPIVDHVFHLIKDNPGITSAEIRENLNWVLPHTANATIQYLLKKRKITADSRQRNHKYYICSSTYQNLHERWYIGAKNMKIVGRHGIEKLPSEMQMILNRPFEQLSIKEAKKLSSEIAKIVNI